MAGTWKRRPAVIGLLVLAAAVVAWYLVSELTWRRTEVTNNSEDAVVQPAVVPPPGGEPPITANTPTPNNDATRGESAVRGDGTSLNGSTRSPNP